MAYGYAGPEVAQHGARRAERIVEAGMGLFGVSEEELRARPCNDWRKRVLAELLQAETTATLDWIRERLAMGDRAYCCRLIQKARRELASAPQMAEAREKIAEMSKSHD